MRSFRFVIFIVCLEAALSLGQPPLSHSDDEDGLFSTGRTTKLDFEGATVEGLNRKPFDSLTQLSEKDRRRNIHLYHKRSEFDSENKDSLLEMRYHQ